MRGCWKWPGFSSILAFRRGSKEQKVEQRGREISLGVILVWGCWWRNFAFATTTPLLVCPKFCFSIIYMEVCQSLSKIDPEGSLVRCGFRIIRHLDKAHLKENFRFAFFCEKENRPTTESGRKQHRMRKKSVDTPFRFEKSAFFEKHQLNKRRCIE